MPICRRLLAQLAVRALDRARSRTENRIAARSATIPVTIKISTSVKARALDLRGELLRICCPFSVVGSIRLRLILLEEPLARFNFLSIQNDVIERCSVVGQNRKLQ